MNPTQRHTFEKLQSQLARLEFSAEFDASLVTAIQSRDQHFRLRGFWAEGTERKNCDLHFYKLDGGDAFVFDHYRLSIRSDIPIPALHINGVDTAALDQKMRAIDWFTLGRAKEGPDELADKRALNDYIGEVLGQLYDLDKTTDGKPLVMLLKAKYLSNTHQIVGSATQEQLDQIDKRYSKTLVVPVRDNDEPLPFTVALEQLEAAKGPVESPARDLYFVYTNGFVKLGGGARGTEGFFNEKRFFSSLPKAYAHVQTAGEGLFGIGDGSVAGPEKLSGKSVIYDGMDDALVAMKFGTMDQHRPGKVVIGWYLNPEKTTAASFEQQTGLHLSQMEQANSDSLIFVQSTTQSTNQSIGHQQAGKIRKPPGNGHGQGM